LTDLDKIVSFEKSFQEGFLSHILSIVLINEYAETDAKHILVVFFYKTPKQSLVFF